MILHRFYISIENCDYFFISQLKYNINYNYLTYIRIKSYIGHMHDTHTHTHTHETLTWLSTIKFEINKKNNYSHTFVFNSIRVLKVFLSLFPNKCEFSTNRALILMHLFMLLTLGLSWTSLSRLLMACLK